MTGLTETKWPRELMRFLWDIVPCPSAPLFMPCLGLTPPSEEIMELMHRESHARGAAIEPISEHLAVNSVLASKAVTAVMLRLDIGPEPENVVDHVVNQNAHAIYAGALSVIGQLVEDGFLAPGPNFNSAPRVTGGN